MKENHLLNINDYKESPLFAALIELNDRLRQKGISGIELNVVGGFAMMTHDLRSRDGITDIDYIGPNMPQKVEEIADEIGFKYNLGRHWINNDVLKAGASLEDLEFSTGKLHFQEAFELESIKINILDTHDLLKMKLIAIDTSLSAVEREDEVLPRAKDFNDISVLMHALNTDTKSIEKEFGEYIINDFTVSAVKAFEADGIDRVNTDVIPLAARQNSMMYDETPKGDYKRSDYLENVLKCAGLCPSPARADKEPPPVEIPGVLQDER